MEFEVVNFLLFFNGVDVAAIVMVDEDGWKVEGKLNEGGWGWMVMGGLWMVINYAYLFVVEL